MENITLRGHHLRLLYQHYIKNVPLKDIRKLITKYYNEKQATKAIEVLSKIVNKQVKLKFTKELDYICLECPNYHSACENDLSRLDDLLYLRRYKIKEGEKYSAEEILKKLREIDAKSIGWIFN